MKSTRLEGIRYWGQYQPDRRIDFNGFHWQSPAGGVLIDPMPLDGDQLEELRGLGGAAWILVTSKEHLRAAPELREALGARLLAPAEERERLGEAAAEVDGWFSRTEDLPPELAQHLEVIPLHGGKSPMEPAFYLKALQALYFADLVRSHASGALRLLPEEKIRDRAEVLVSLREVADLPVEAVLLGDGDGIYRGAEEALRELLGTAP
jgi:hypothetical protein